MVPPGADRTRVVERRRLGLCMCVVVENTLRYEAVVTEGDGCNIKDDCAPRKVLREIRPVAENAVSMLWVFQSAIQGQGLLQHV